MSVGRDLSFWWFAGRLGSSLSVTRQTEVCWAVSGPFDWSAACLWEARSVANKSVSWEGLKGFAEITEPGGGECAGVTFTVVKAGSGLSNDLSDHFWSNSSIPVSSEDLWDLEASDLEDLSVLVFESLEECALTFSEGLDFFFPELESGDCKIPWSSTAPTTITEDGSMREELEESCLGVSLTFLRSRFSFLSL